MASQPLQVRQYGFAKNSKKPYHKRIFKKSGDIFFGATSQKKHLQKQVLFVFSLKLAITSKYSGRVSDVKCLRRRNVLTILYSAALHI